MQRLITSYLSEMLERFVIDYHPDQLQVKLMQGYMELKDVEFDCKELGAYMKAALPWLELKSFSSSYVRIKIPGWTKLKSQPIVLSLGTVQINVVEAVGPLSARTAAAAKRQGRRRSPHSGASRSSDESKADDQDSPKGYTFAQKVIDGMTVDIAAVNIRMELSGVPLRSEDSADPSKKRRSRAPRREAPQIAELYFFQVNGGNLGAFFKDDDSLEHIEIRKVFKCESSFLRLSPAVNADARSAHKRGAAATPRSESGDDSEPSDSVHKREAKQLVLFDDQTVFLHALLKRNRQGVLESVLFDLDCGDVALGVTDSQWHNLNAWLRSLFYAMDRGKVIPKVVPPGIRPPVPGFDLFSDPELCWSPLVNDASFTSIAVRFSSLRLYFLPNEEDEVDANFRQKLKEHLRESSADKGSEFPSTQPKRSSNPRSDAAGKSGSRSERSVSRSASSRSVSVSTSTTGQRVFPAYAVGETQSEDCADNCPNALAAIFVESISVGVLYPVGTFSNPEALEREDFRRSSRTSATAADDRDSPPRSFESYLSVSVGDLCSLVRKNLPTDGKKDGEEPSPVDYKQAQPHVCLISSYRDGERRKRLEQLTKAASYSPASPISRFHGISLVTPFLDWRLNSQRCITLKSVSQWPRPARPKLAYQMDAQFNSMHAYADPYPWSALVQLTVPASIRTRWAHLQSLLVEKPMPVTLYRCEVNDFLLRLPSEQLAGAKIDISLKRVQWCSGPNLQETQHMRGLVSLLSSELAEKHTEEIARRLRNALADPTATSWPCWELAFDGFKIDYVLDDDQPRREEMGDQSWNSLVIESGRLSSVYLPGIEGQPDTQFAMFLPLISVNMSLASMNDLRAAIKSGTARTESYFRSGAYQETFETISTRVNEYVSPEATKEEKQGDTDAVKKTNDKEGDPLGAIAVKVSPTQSSSSESSEGTEDSSSDRRPWTFVLWTAIDHAKFDISNSVGKRTLFGSSSDSSLALERGRDRLDFRYFAESLRLETPTEYEWKQSTIRACQSSHLATKSDETEQLKREDGDGTSKERGPSHAKNATTNAMQLGKGARIWFEAANSGQEATLSPDGLKIIESLIDTSAVERLVTQTNRAQYKRTRRQLYAERLKSSSFVSNVSRSRARTRTSFSRSSDLEPRPNAAASGAIPVSLRDAPRAFPQDHRRRVSTSSFDANDVSDVIIDSLRQGSVDLSGSGSVSNNVKRTHHRTRSASTEVTLSRSFLRRGSKENVNSTPSTLHSAAPMTSERKNNTLTLPSGSPPSSSSNLLDKAPNMFSAKLPSGSPPSSSTNLLDKVPNMFSAKLKNPFTSLHKSLPSSDSGSAVSDGSTSVDTPSRSAMSKLGRRLHPSTRSPSNASDSSSGSLDSRQHSPRQKARKFLHLGPHKKTPKEGGGTPSASPPTTMSAVSSSKRQFFPMRPKFSRITRPAEASKTESKSEVVTTSVTDAGPSPAPELPHTSTSAVQQVHDEPSRSISAMSTQETHTSVSQSITEVANVGGVTSAVHRTQSAEVDTLIAHTQMVVPPEDAAPRDITREDIDDAAYSALTEQAELIKQLLAENRALRLANSQRKVVVDKVSNQLQKAKTEERQLMKSFQRSNERFVTEVDRLTNDLRSAQRDISALRYQNSQLMTLIPAQARRSRPNSLASSRSESVSSNKSSSSSGGGRYGRR